MKNFSEVLKHNEFAWDKKVNDGYVWTVPFTTEEINKARRGELNVPLAINPMPRHWLPADLKNKKILCLASGGGQQGPLFAAAGAKVTVLDLSEKQLEQDQLVAKRENLELTTVKGNMCDLSQFEDHFFDIVFCPVSVTFIEDTTPVFTESYRVLKQGGTFYFGAPNPLIYLFDGEKWDHGIFEVANTLPFNSFDEMTDEESKQFIQEGQAIEYSHTLEDLIGGQTAAGFVITNFKEEKRYDMLSTYTATYFITSAMKLRN